MSYNGLFIGMVISSRLRERGIRCYPCLAPVNTHGNGFVVYERTSLETFRDKSGEFKDEVRVEVRAIYRDYSHSIETAARVREALVFRGVVEEVRVTDSQLMDATEYIEDGNTFVQLLTFKFTIAL